MPKERSTKTFVGVADDGSFGSLRFFETFTLDGSTFDFHLEFRIVEGTGDFAGSRGTGTFDGIVVGTTGVGSYAGSWVRPHRK